MTNFELVDRKYLLRCQKGTEVREFSQLRCEFDIKQFGDSKLNELSLSVTNLDKPSRSFFETNEKYSIFIELFAGYKEHSGLIFSGNTDLINIKKGTGVDGFHKTENRQDETDWITTLTAKDGIKITKNQVFTIAKRGRVSVSSVIQSVVDSLGFPKGSIKTSGFKKEYWNNGISSSGPGWDFLVKLCKANGFTADIKSGVLNIRKISEPFGNEVIVLNSNSGLILSPEETEKGIKAKSLLRHDIVTGSLVKIESKYITGYYLITNVTHEGDSDGEKWFTNLEAQFYDK